MSKEDRDKLRNFLTDLEWAFGDILSTRALHLDPEIRDYASRVSGDISVRIQLVRSQLVEPGNEEELDDQLEWEGLVREQLDMKLHGFNRAMVAWRFRPSPRIWDPRTWFRNHKSRLVSWAKRMLEWANLILDSLSKVISAAGMIAEYKKALELAMKEDG